MSSNLKIIELKKLAKSELIAEILLLEEEINDAALAHKRASKMESGSSSESGSKFVLSNSEDKNISSSSSSTLPCPLRPLSCEYT